MEIRVLKYFLAVAREENITRAAEALHITQPTLSRQLSQLEEDIGVRLFDRKSRRITLTSEGILLRRRAEEIIELADKTERELVEHDDLVNGEISIGCGELESVKILPMLFSSFSRKYPNVTYDLYTGNADYIKERMNRGITDIGLLLEPVNIEKFDFVRLNVKEKWVVIMRADDKLAEKESINSSDLANLPIIMVKRAAVKGELASWFGDDFERINIRYVSNMSTNATVMVYYGLGYALTIEGSLPYLDKSKVTCRPLYPELTATSLIAWKRGQPFSRATTKFIEHIKESSIDFSNR